MPWYVRIGFRPDRWIPLPWLAAGEAQADAVRDFNGIRDNELSVFLVNTQADGLRAAVAIASKREQKAAFGYALFDSAAINALGIQIVQTNGDTPDATVNSWHYELQQLTFSRLSEIAKIIRQPNALVEDIPLPTFKNHVKAAIAAGQLDPQQVDEKNVAQ